MKNIIPKVIHYCWFGNGEKSELAMKCIESWKKYCPDYKIIEWNENNFDINSNLYVKQAYQNKKYAFVTDYVRLFVLYNYGGVYMDTDVEILKPIDCFLSNQAFSSFESNNMIPTGLMASCKNNDWVKELLDEYENLTFIKKDGTFDMTTNVIRITNLTKKKYGLKPISSFQVLKNGLVTIYPYDYFCPKDVTTGQINITENTYAIHHFSGSWLPKNIVKEKELRRKIIEKSIKKYGKEKGQKIGKIKFWIFFLILHPIFASKEILKRIKERIGKE